MKKVKIGLLALLAVVALLFAGATLVQAAEEADGVGNVLIYPLYLADSTAFTEFTLVNLENTAAGDTTEAVHIQIRSQGDSQDQLDFCICLTENDVYKAKISSDGAGGAILETLNDVDHVGANVNCRAPETAGLTEADTSDCAYGTQKGYIVAYAVSGCGNHTIETNASMMGNTRIIETATSKIMALNAVAVQTDANPPTFGDVQDALNKDELYMIWEFEKTAAVLTVPSLGDTGPINDDLDLVGADDEGNICDELKGCGLAQLTTDFEEMYDLDEVLLARQSPHYYPANEVSIVNFADAGKNTDSTNFYINGSAKYWGLNLTSAELTEGWTRWTIPDKDQNGDSLDALHKVVCTYFISTNNSLAWMPCQYEACSGK
jgi:hypothetical protein